MHFWRVAQKGIIAAGGNLCGSRSTDTAQACYTLLTGTPHLREGQATHTSGARSPFLKEVLAHADLVVRNLFRNNLFVVNESGYGLSSIPELRVKSMRFFPVCR